MGSNPTASSIKEKALYQLNDRYQDSNGYILIYQPHHRKAITSGSFKGYVYEHLIVAERFLGRPLSEGDVVHHLDRNRSNNSPDNLLIISGPMHVRLHSWLDKHEIIPSPSHQKRIDAGCVRCITCHTPINYGEKYCSHVCHQKDSFTYKHPPKEELEKMIWSKPMTEIAKELNISDVMVSKICKKLGIEKPKRGHWLKKSNL